MRKILCSMLLVLMLVVSIPVKAITSNNINDYVSGDPIYKWYDGNKNWSNESVSPVAIHVSDELTEGVDYIREYAFTQDRRANDTDLTDWKSSSEGMSDSGFIWERVTGIGKYNNSYAVRNEIYTAIFIYANNITKVKGEDDPEFAYKVVMHNENPNDITDMLDITFEREPGEKVGTYNITPIVKKKSSISDDKLLQLNSMLIGDDTKGRVYIYPQIGKLTITDKEDNTDTVSIDDVIDAPDTGIK